MPGEKNEMSILDATLANDDFDYGDKPVVQNDNEDDTIDETVEPVQPVNQQTQTPEQSIAGQAVEQRPLASPGQVPITRDAQGNAVQLKRVGAQFADGKGNIVDKDGKIIARAGESARHWQEASRANAQVSNLTRQVQTIQRERDQEREIVRQAREIAELPTKMGLSREDYNEGITLMARWRADPVTVAREIVARTLTFGHNVSDILGKTAGDALEMRAVTHLVNQATAPMKQQQELAARQQQEAAQGEAQYNAFITQYPDAELHANEIASLMGKGRSAETAYYQVKTFALENGLDFSQPLGPQVAALREQRLPTAQRPTGQRTAPMANGGRGNEQQMTTEPAMADASEDWSSILKSVMQSPTEVR